MIHDPIIRTSSIKNGVDDSEEQPTRDEVVTIHSPQTESSSSSINLHPHDPISQQELSESMSSVDYFSCCGLGHRLSKMSDAYYVAKKKLNFQLRVFWASCELPTNNNNDDNSDATDTDTQQANHHHPTSVEVFSYFFGPQPFSEIQALHQKHQQALMSGNALINNHTKNHNLRLNNEIPGFKKFKRQSKDFYYVPIQQNQPVNNIMETKNNDRSIPPNNNRTTSQEVCPCQGLEDFFEETADFHGSIKERFVKRNPTLIEYWRERFQFSNHTVFGLHVRGGNGENGDFLRKNRGLEDWDAWSSSMAQLIAKIMIRQEEEWSTNTTNPKPPPPLLFLATDTDSILRMLQHHLEGILPVVSLPQEREAEGSGVAFGNQILVHGKCLEKWQNSILDMMLLSDAHVIIAGRPSSFTQSLPMSIALSRKHNNPTSIPTIKAPYCEVNRNATLYQCFSAFEDWCCNGKSSFHMEGIHPGYEYRRLPLALKEEDFLEKIQPRRAINFQNVPLNPGLPRRKVPLPYDWALVAKK